MTHAVIQTYTRSGNQWRKKQLDQLRLGVVRGGFIEVVVYEQHLVKDWKQTGGEAIGEEERLPG